MTSGRISLRRTSTDPTTYDAGARAGSNFPSAADLAFPRGGVSQTLRDIAALIFCALFVCVTGVGIAAAFFILIFVRT